MCWALYTERVKFDEVCGRWVRDHVICAGVGIRQGEKSLAYVKNDADQSSVARVLYSRTQGKVLRRFSS